MEIKVIGRMDHTLDNTYESANRIYSQYGLCPTIPTGAGGGHQPKILEGEENMSERQNSIKAKKLPNGNIRFYQDDEKKSAVSELQLQSAEGVAQAITTANVLKVYEETKCVGGIGEKKSNGGKQFYQQDRVYKGDIALAQPANLSGGSYNYIVASRGRGEHNEQRLEPNLSGCTNTITTVQKDNYCLEIKQATKEGSIKCKVGGCYDSSYPNSKTRRGRVQEGGDVTPTITVQGGENINFVETRCKIRKLTPREHWRLMGFSDSDFDKASKVCSNTQLYKQAGNSIVVNVLMGIFSQML